MPDLHSLPTNSRPSSAIRNNGPDSLALERYKLRELAEGWPCYRDACEWANLASLFHPNAYIYTTWTGRTLYTDFIAASQRGMDAGAFIMHRCHGLTTDIDPAHPTRAITKMKATITQRFALPCRSAASPSSGEETCDVDAESDCRFCFFWEKIDGKWGARFVRHWYEKDKLVAVDPGRVPRELDQERLMGYPVGYRYLAYCQEKVMGVRVKRDMPGHRRVAGEGDPCGEEHDRLYWQCKRWVEGEDVDV